MTPEQYLKIEHRQRRIIHDAKRTISFARTLALKCELPACRRQATVDDIQEGAVIWHIRKDDTYYWHVVDSRLHQGDPFKAYVADDGCRYGLDGAWVRSLAGRKNASKATAVHSLASQL